MMRRLRDSIDSDDPAVAELARLLGAMGDLEPRIGAVHRVRAAMARREQSRRTWHVRAAVVLVLAVASPLIIIQVKARSEQETATPPYRADETVGENAAAASTATPPRAPSVDLPDVPAVGVPAVLARSLPHAAATPVSSSVPRRSPERAAHRLPPDEPHGAAIPDAGASPAELAVESSATPGMESPALDVDPSPGGGNGRPPAASHETALILGALHALRRDHDPRSALRQLDAYRHRFAAGDLAEEALALSVEALAALDDRTALSLAEEYVRRFPQGRFRSLAELARRRFLPP
jgi:hypothetical protein